jgi:protocatechuate 3,4-dioxygenase beta subunit
MKRLDFLRAAGAAGVASMIPWNKAHGAPPPPGGGGCWLTPQETEGPYYFDPGLIRQDIREAYPGTPLYMTLNVVDINCAPIPNVLVDIWHCDAAGVYSGYPGQQGGLNTTGLTFLRGTQMTDFNGQVQFTTIYPGWYPGRAVHVHFKVRITGLTYVTSQWCFPDGMNNTVHASAPYGGSNPTTNAGDGIFGSSLPLYEVMDVVSDGNGGYTGNFTIGIQGDFPNGFGSDHALTGGQFTLHQNTPNPVEESTVIRFHLASASTVRLEVFDTMGRNVGTLLNGNLAAGDHRVEWDAHAGGSRLAPGNYLYQITTNSVDGTFRQSRVLSVIQ